jgi:hypothetical protein
MLKRKPNWEKALDAFLNAHRADPFQYGTWDCCLFAAGAIEAMTGTDIAVDFRGLYTTRQEATAAIAAITGGSTVRDAAAFCASKFGMAAVPKLMCRRGDMVLIERGGGDWSMGIVSLNGLDVAVVTENGIEATPIASCASGWRV